MSAQLPIETEHRDIARPPRNREDVLRVLRQMMAQGARVVRLGARVRRAVGDPTRRPPTAR